MKAAQSELVESYELLRDGLAGIDSNMQDALSSDAAAANRANEAIANYMRYFVARDVLFAQAQTEIDQVLSDQGIEVDGKPAKVTDSVFLDDDAWLERSAGGPDRADRRGRHERGDTGRPWHGADRHDHQARRRRADRRGPGHRERRGPFTLEVQVTNGPENEESDVLVTVEVTGGPQRSRARRRSHGSSREARRTASIELKPSPPAGQEVSVQVTVQPVPGETLTTNNTATYPVTFGG